MYRRKLSIFAGSTLFLIVVTSVMVVTTSQITRSNLKQNEIAQSLLTEHLIVSSTSYRLFKQLTDELIFGRDANQAEVRNKRAIIEQSIAKIKMLEEKQRQALGAVATQGTIEDTNALSVLIDDIIIEFRAIINKADSKRLAQQQRVQQLLEVTIDNRFREAINAAVTRQSNVVATLNARIEAFNQSLFWYSVLLAILAVPIVIFGCYWLVGILYQPLNSIRLGSEAIAQGNYQYRISRGFDAEFDAIAASFNSMAEELLQQREQVTNATRELEFQVAKRTTELTNANKLLQDKDKARREFLADISHELRTPLTIIRGEVQVTLRQQSITEEDYQSTLKNVLEQSLSLSRLVDDLLLVARFESGKLRVTPQTVNIRKFVSETTKQIQTLIERKNAALKVSIQEGLSIAKFDPERIAQVIMVVLDNSLNYSNEGGTIKFECYLIDNTIKIMICDEGEGIAPEMIPYIFDRYFRGANSRSSQGAGLGLAIAKTIVQSHGGTIDVVSTLGEGSQFTILLPQESPTDG